MAQQSERDKLIEAQRDYERRKKGGTTGEQASPSALLAALRAKQPLRSKKTVSPMGALAPSLKALRSFDK
jgi:hypothetical protein